MLPTKKTMESATVILNDLIKINNDRIGCYQQVINQATNLDIDLIKIFKEIIAESNTIKQELIAKIVVLEGDPKDVITISGMIHRAWAALKVTFTGNTRRSIINFCEYNEEVTQHTYRAATDMLKKLNNEELYAFVETQQIALLNSYQSIKKYHEAHNYFSSRLAYYN